MAQWDVSSSLYICIYACEYLFFSRSWLINLLAIKEKETKNLHISWRHMSSSIFVLDKEHNNIHQSVVCTNEVGKKIDMLKIYTEHTVENELVNIINPWKIFLQFRFLVFWNLEATRAVRGEDEERPLHFLAWILLPC